MKIRRQSRALDFAPGERLLAHAESSEGVVVGTVAALYIPGHRIGWEQVETAEWDLVTRTLRVVEVGTWGRTRPEHTVILTDHGRLLQLVRERVTATVLLQRHVPIDGKSGVRVIARRAPTGERELTWLFEYDAGIDPDDPFVEHVAQEALDAARAEVGES